MTYGCPTEPIPDVTTPLDEPLRSTAYFPQWGQRIDTVISQPTRPSDDKPFPAEACCEEHGDSELRRAVRETRQINTADGRIPLSVNDDVE